MNFGRAAKYGSIAAGGALLISIGTGGLMRIAWAERTAGFEGRAMGVVLLVASAGLIVATMYLFIVIGAFLDREFEARGLDRREQ